MSTNLTLQYLWQLSNFEPTSVQEQAILHTQGPLFLTAGPGSGKTRVLLWRTVNLIVFHQIKPEEIFLSTFTEKAARQLKEGLKNYLGLVTNLTDIPYDISKMYVGTIHSLCQNLLSDRRFAQGAHRITAPAVLDELSQYFLIANRRNWRELMQAGGLAEKAEEEQNFEINQFFAGPLNQGYVSKSRYEAINNCISFFNRLSEESIDYYDLLNRQEEGIRRNLLRMYAQYRNLLSNSSGQEKCDYSLLQQKAYDLLQVKLDSGNVFKHIIIDEYQDTNTIQEKLFFKLCEQTKNICVVGDDDQAMYRFRGATVENFVEFPKRCQKYLTTSPTQIPLNINYRSRKQVVNFYTEFISRFNWQKEHIPSEYYRIQDKKITANSADEAPSVIASTAARPEDVATEIAYLVQQLLDTGKVKDPNQIAFLFPSLKYNGVATTQVTRMKRALEEQGLRVYAPRAGRFLDVIEAKQVFGIFSLVFGKPNRGNFSGQDYNAFHTWIDTNYDEAVSLCKQHTELGSYVKEKRSEINIALADYQALLKTIKQSDWDLTAIYQPNMMKRPLVDSSGISEKCKKNLTNAYFNRSVERRLQGLEPDLAPFTLSEVVTRSTSLDWSILDLFYRLSGFPNFKEMFDLAETGVDEGPICNLALISRYLAKFVELYSLILTADFLSNNKFKNLFFYSFLYTIYRRGESEFENEEDPFPKGRIPFLTIHQAKGLEFPVVILGNLRKDDNGAPIMEQIIRELVPKNGEPLDRLSGFDIARMYYVALSRPQNLLILAHFSGQGQRINEPFRRMLGNSFPRIPQLDLNTLPTAKPSEDKAPKAYSYTADYLLYEKCPRQYMIFRRYGFVPSRTQTQFFGSLVHKTIEDLHYRLINRDAQ